VGRRPEALLILGSILSNVVGFLLIGWGDFDVDKFEIDKEEKFEQPLVGRRGRSQTPGKPFNPTRVTEEAPKVPRPPRAVPIGLPMSQEGYEKLKKAAKRRKLSNTENAQEDPLAAAKQAIRAGRFRRVGSWPERA